MLGIIGLAAYGLSGTKKPENDQATAQGKSDTLAAPGKSAADEAFEDLTKDPKALPPKLSDTTAEDTPPPSQWTSSTNVSQIADTKDVHLRTTARDVVKDKFGRSYTPKLLINCRENKTNLYIDFDGMFVADSASWGEVTFRIDKEKAETWDFIESTDNGALGLWNGRGVPLIKRLAGKSRFRVRATPFNESPVEFEFSLIGFDTELRALRDACKW